MISGDRRGAVAVLGIAVSLAALVLVPDRANLVIPLPAVGGWTNRLILPVGVWAAALAYAWSCWKLVGGPARETFVAALRAAIVMHAVLLLRTFVPALGDAARFTIAVYRVYGITFVVVALVCSVAWTVRTLWFAKTGAGGSSALDAPLWAASAALASTVVAYWPATGVLAVGAGLVTGWALTRNDASPGQLVPPPVRRLFASHLAWSVGIFVVALALRLAFSREVMTVSNYVETGPDGPTYDAFAWATSQGQPLPADFVASHRLMLFGYVRFVAVIYAIFGRSYFAVCVVQSLLGAAACVLAYDVARRTFGIATARLTALFTATSFLAIFSAAALAHQAVDIFLTVLLVWLLIRYARSDAPGSAGAAVIGVVLGAAIANRETAASVWLLLLAWLPWTISRRIGWPRAIARAGVMTAAMLVLVAPLLRPIVASPESRALARSHMDYLFKASARDRLAAPFADPATAARQLRDRPVFVIDTLVTSIASNFAVQFLEQSAGSFDLTFLQRGSSFYYGMWSLVDALACAGLIVALRRAFRRAPESPDVLLILSVIAVRTAMHLFLASTYLHRAPIEPFLIMLGSVATAGLFGARTTPLPENQGTLRDEEGRVDRIVIRDALRPADHAARHGLNRAARI